MKYITLFENFNSDSSILIIVDVQKSFKKFFNDNYLSELNEYAKKFKKVYQIFDNHHEGKSVDKDYLYDEDPNLDNLHDLYSFPNQKELIEKRYNYDVDVDFYKKILDEEVYNQIVSREGKLKQGEYFPTTEGTVIVYIGNNHQWFHVPKKLYEIFQELKQAQSENLKIEIVGGASGECLEDIITAAKSLGLVIQRNPKFIYSASFCPIK
jgi:hypothetical protein